MTVVTPRHQTSTAQVTKYPKPLFPFVHATLIFRVVDGIVGPICVFVDC
jgi:hypothetical protein